jgi:hypothetical protein
MLLMSKLWVTTLAGLALGLAACRPSDPDKSYEVWELRTFKDEAKSHEQVILICIYTNHFERRPVGYHRLQSKGIVVRSYKGDWQVGEPILLHDELESVPEGWVPPVGYLMYYMLNTHTNGPVWAEPGEEWEYKPQFERSLELMFPRGGRK